MRIYIKSSGANKFQLTREPKQLPTMQINKEINSIFDFKYEDFQLNNYDAYPHIKGVVAV